MGIWQHPINGCVPIDELTDHSAFAPVSTMAPRFVIVVERPEWRAFGPSASSARAVPSRASVELLGCRVALATLAWLVGPQAATLATLALAAAHAATLATLALVAVHAATLALVAALGGILPWHVHVWIPFLTHVVLPLV